MINYYRASVRQSQKEAAAKLRPISAPTLVIWGQEDGYLGRGVVANPGKRNAVKLLSRVRPSARSARFCTQNSHGQSLVYSCISMAAS